MIDLLEPQYHGRLMRNGPGRLLDNLEDLIVTSTDSSRWLLNVPKFEAIAIDKRGLPVRIVALDPRAFSLQKLWIARNDRTRDPANRRRDEEQAHLVARLAVRHSGLSFDDGALSALPLSFRKLTTALDLGDTEVASDW
jgi:antitoxin (DNA-binding transcriptional repressor) of toxin-antitoxin stability system